MAPDSDDRRLEELLARLRDHARECGEDRFIAALAECVDGACTTELDCPLAAMILDLYDRMKEAPPVQVVIRRFLDGAAHRVADAAYMKAVTECEASGGGGQCPMFRALSGTPT